MKEPSNNKITEKKVQLTSWKSHSDPSIGNFSVSLELPNIPEIYVWNVWNQEQPYWRSGPWNGSLFLGEEGMVSGNLSGFHIESENNGTFYLTYLFAKGYPYYGLIVLNPQGTLEVTMYQNKKEIISWNVQNSDCDIYGFCGAFGSCNSQASPICNCLRGFEPRNVNEWNKQNWTSGCVRRTPLECEKGKNDSESGKEDEFLKLQKTKVPDFLEQSSTFSEDRCRSQCLQNCSCIAYAYDPFISCMHWSGNLTDIVSFSKGEINLYIRVANSELGDHTDSDRDLRVIVTVPLLVGIVIVTACACLLRRCAKHSGGKNHGNQKHVELDDLPLLKLEELATATNNFHSANMLGEGGFGPVYKGVLEGEQEIAVKRLSNASGQGLEEFMNEAWRFWNEGRIMTLIDPEMSYSMCDRDQIMRCIHIGLLCVQELARKRPSMSTVLGMLYSEIENLPPPKEVGFLQKQQVRGRSSSNSVTFTEIQGR
ncbi:hypothetical protein L6164_036518 [Bauhinia variegata]|uniref:Uncharacterized protein n=1 Tax=Bauhinia variegata TaxID=167791 RepID=A0ACB9KHE3_BAUVA|nr:hypothetical protein L6164_036518 [Bauhinia variegata]